MEKNYDLLIVDYDLDDGKGDELVRANRVLDPGPKIIAVSALDARNAALVHLDSMEKTEASKKTK